MYIPSYYLEFYPSASIMSTVFGKFPIEYGDKTIIITDPVMSIKNPMVDSGIILPGFNDDFKGTAPDQGAFEVGNPPLVFGRRAHLNFDEGWTPWERF